MELIIVAGKRLVDDMDWMQDEREHHVMQQITQQYLCVERRWKQLLNRGQEWGGLLDNLYPEMKQCQVSFFFVLIQQWKFIMTCKFMTIRTETDSEFTIQIS